MINLIFLSNEQFVLIADCFGKQVTNTKLERLIVQFTQLQIIDLYQVTKRFVLINIRRA